MISHMLICFTYSLAGASELTSRMLNQPKAHWRAILIRLLKPAAAVVIMLLYVLMWLFAFSQ